MVQVTSNTNLVIDSPQGRKLFVFDRVFGPDVTQEGIWEYLSDSVNAFTQGYNVSLLAYGQSGAGKSYTMGTSGPDEQGDMEVMGMHNTIFPSASPAVSRCEMLCKLTSLLRCHSTRGKCAFRETRRSQRKSESQLYVAITCTIAILDASPVRFFER